MFNYGQLIKWGVIVAAMTGFCVGLIAYGENRKQREWDASLGTQAMLSASQIIAQAVNTANVEIRYIKVKGATKTVTQTVEKEVIRYVDASMSCQLSPEFERVYDTVSGLLSADALGLPASTRATRDLAASASAPVTDAAVLLSHEALVTQYRDLWETYAALVSWVRSSYLLQVEAAGPQ